MHDDLARVLHEEIERLPERFRVPLVLCDLEGRSHDQAARHLGWPIGTVKSRQARGRERLRDRLRRTRCRTPGGGARDDDAARSGQDCGFSGAGRSHDQGSDSICLWFVPLIPGTAFTLARGVLTSMHFTLWSKAVSVLLFLGATASGVGWLAQKELLFAVQAPPAQVQAARADDAGGDDREARQAQCRRQRAGQPGGVA